MVVEKSLLKARAVRVLLVEGLGFRVLGFRV